jgi:transposase-like protein
MSDAVFRWRYDRPPSLEQFQLQFPDDFACAAYLAEKRWPNGFICPHCGSMKGWKLRSKPWVWECAGEVEIAFGELVLCRKQTSVIAGTIMHRTHLPLRQWFLAAHLVTTHSNGISALQLQAKLGIGSYKTAWLLLHKLRSAMVNPERAKIGGPDVVVEVDETQVPFRTKSDPVGGGQGNSTVGKLMIIGAVEHIDRGHAGRLRLERIPYNAAETLQSFVARNTKPGTTIFTDGNAGYNNPKERKHKAKVIGKLAAHVFLPHIHRVFSLMKRWMMGVYHGVRKLHIDRYLQEYVFRWNRRRQFRAAFDSLLTIGNAIKPMTYRDLVGRPPVLKTLLREVLDGDKTPQEAYKEALDEGVLKKFAKRLLDPYNDPLEPPVYTRHPPRRPILAKRKTAFVTATF